MATLPRAHNTAKINDDVQFFWALVSASWEGGESQALLELVVEQYVTVCGFSFASGWMEEYKQANKKSLQKSKGLRKVLVPKITIVQQ